MTEFMENRGREIDGVCWCVAIGPEIPLRDVARKGRIDVKSSGIEVLVAVLVCKCARIPDIGDWRVREVAPDSAHACTAKYPWSERRELRTHRDGDWSDDQAGPDINGMLKGGLCRWI